MTNEIYHFTVTKKKYLFSVFSYWKNGGFPQSSLMYYTRYATHIWLNIYHHQRQHFKMCIFFMSCPFWT